MRRRIGVRRHQEPKPGIRTSFRSTKSSHRSTRVRSLNDTQIPQGTAPLILLFASFPVLAQVGFYKWSDPPGIARQWGELCIQQGSAGTLKVSLFGGYCPTVENDCSNERFDDTSFEAKPEKGVLLHQTNECKLKVVLGKNGAKVTQQGHCSDYGLFAGTYVKRASEVWENDCSPLGGPDTHHE